MDIRVIEKNGVFYPQFLSKFLFIFCYWSYFKEINEERFEWEPEYEVVYFMSLERAIEYAKNSEKRTNDAKEKVVWTGQ